MLLRHHLQGETDRHAKHTAVEDGRPGGNDGVQCRGLEYQRQDQADHRAGGELDESQAQRVVTAGEESHQQYVNTPDEGAGQLQPVAGGYGEAFADAEQEHADHCQAGAQPDAGAAALADQQAENRYHDHVQPGDEA